MELSEIRTAKAEAEEKILKAVSQAMLEFIVKRGLSFENVSVNMQEVTQLKDANRKYVPSSVNCKVVYD